jgi:hypothetical protein
VLKLLLQGADLVFAAELSGWLGRHSCSEDAFCTSFFKRSEEK